MSHQVVSPVTTEDFQKYYQLRYKVLREPWQQPKGSETDAMEDISIHAMVKNELGEVIGAGRLQLNSETEGQIRYMCVDERYQKQGIGKVILKYLEGKAREKKCHIIVLNARNNIANFYIQNGYENMGDAETLYGSIEHVKMKKIL